MTRLDLLKRVQKRKKQIGLTIDNIAKLSNLGNRTITRFLAGEDVKISKYSTLLLISISPPYLNSALWRYFFILLNLIVL
jgi:transcriptional regulator with XRE-family HTH domain